MIKGEDGRAKRRLLAFAALLAAIGGVSVHEAQGTAPTAHRATPGSNRGALSTPPETSAVANDSRLAPNVSITPDNGEFRPLPTAWVAFSFTVKNTGTNAGTFALTSSCSAAAVAAGSCSTTPSDSVTLAPNESTFVGMQFYSGNRTNTGTLILRARLLSDTTVRDSGYASVFVTNSPIVTPDSLVKLRPASTSVSDTFVVNNPQPVARTHNYTATCMWIGNPISCTRSPASATLAAGASGNVIVTYTTGTQGQVGSIYLKAVRQDNATIFDSGHVKVAAYAKPVITPSGTTFANVQPRITTSVPMVVRNPGGGAMTYNLQASCTGAAITGGSCTVMPASVALAGETSAQVTVAFTAGAQSTSGSIKLVGTLAGTTVRDSATNAVSTQVLGVAITPDAMTRTHSPNQTVVRDSFQVANSGQSPDDYSLTVSCTGAAIVPGSCTVTPIVSLAPGASSPVWVQYATGGLGTTSTVVLRAKSGVDSISVVDSAVSIVSVPVPTPVRGISVTPQAASNTPFIAPHLSTDTVVFQVTNLNNVTDVYNVRVHCSGPAIMANTCVPVHPQVASGQPLTIGPNATVAGNWVKFASSIGTSSPIWLVLENVYDPTVRDSGVVWVSTGNPTVGFVSVTPKALVRYRPTSSAVLSDTFTVTNTSPNGDSFTLSVNCPLTVLVPGSCLSPIKGPVFIAGGTSLQVPMDYRTSTSVGFSDLTLTATGTIPNNADQGWFRITTASPPPAVSVNVLALRASRTLPVNYATGQEQFQVNNSGSRAQQFVLSVACTSPPIQTGTCSSSPSGVIWLGAGAVMPAFVNYSTSAQAASGSVKLTVTSLSTPSVFDADSTLVITSTAVPIAVTATPKAGQAFGRPTSSSDSVRFVATNSGASSASFRFSWRCGGVAIVGNSCALVGATPATIPVGDSAVRWVRFTTAPQSAQTARVDFFAKYAADSTIADSAAYDVSTVAAATSVAVTPDNGSQTNLPVGPLQSVNFVVKNTSAGTGAFVPSRACTNGAVCGAFTPTVITLAPGDSSIVPVGFTMAASGASGRVAFYAQLQSNPTVQDSGWYNVQARGVASVIVELPRIPQPSTLAREHCLTFALGGDAATECGDLRLIHAMPAVQTLGTVRVPHLTYISNHAHPQPVVAVDISRASGVASVDSMELILSVRGVERVRRKLNPTVTNTKPVARVHVSFDAINDTTGVHPIDVRVISWRPALVDTAHAFTQLALVNRKLSPLGAGWWISGLERLVQVNANKDSLLWIGGDGSTRVFVRSSANDYVAEQADAPELLRFDAASSRYLRVLKGRTEVRFDNAGLHRETRNRLGQITSFTYDTAGGQIRLKTIEIPPTTANHRYTFVYSATSALLDSVRAPASPGQPRNLHLSRDGTGRLQFIRGPDTSRVSFTYDATRSMLVVSRKSRRGFTRFFAYDSAWRVRSDSQMLAGNEFIRSTYRNAVTLGYVITGATAAATADTALVYTRLDGPRLDVSDTTGFWLDGFGAPRRIRDALGQSTLINRADGQYPALVTMVSTPNGLPGGFIQQALYDARGNIRLMTDVNGLGNGVNATTSFVWDPACDMLASATYPENNTFTATYDAVTCNRLTQSDSRGTASMVQFRYGASTGSVAAGMLTSVIYPPDPTRPGQSDIDSLTYDTRGNVETTRSPLGFVSTVQRDGLGRDTSSFTPINATLQQQSRRSYDLYDRPLHSEIIGPSVPYTMRRLAADTAANPALTQVADNRYDVDGQLVSVRGSTIPSGDIFTFDTLTYDEAGRLLTRALGSGPRIMKYDPAGNSDTLIYPGGLVTAQTFDVLNRMTKRITPHRDFAQTFCAGRLQSPLTTGGCQLVFPFHPNNGTGYRAPSDTTAFAYDAGGRMILGDNADARIRRAYYPNGLLRFDTLRIRTVTSPPYIDGSYLSQGTTLGYGYDRNGRRTTLTTPSGTITYAHYGFGALQHLIDVTGNRFEAVWNGANQWTGTNVYAAGGALGVTETRNYDADGRLIARARSSTSFSQLTLDSLFYDRRDKIVDARTQSAVFGGEQTTTAYDGIGAVLAYERTENQVVGAYEAEEYRNDALGNVLYSRPRSSASGMVNPYIASYLGNGEMIARQSIVPNPPPQGAILSEMANGHVSGGMQTSDETRQDHNLQFQLQSFTRQYQGADGKLRAVQRYGWVSSSFSKGTWEEYGYDALGRRVFTRVRRSGTSTPPYVPLCMDAATGSCKSFFEYVVWDGDQVLVETRQPDGAADNSNTGQVLNLHLLGLDTPIGVVRNGTTRVINPNWRGLGESSVLPNGSAGDCGLQPVTGCAVVSWPASDGAYFTPGPSAGSGGSVLGGRTWLGTNVANGVGTTGFLYRRNRYYDPSSGRFTQEDPIGLAGGLNLYGFANGDPVNFSDPFGLCPNPFARGLGQLQCIAQDFIAGGRAAAGRVVAAATARLEAAADRTLNCLSDMVCAATMTMGGTSRVAGVTRGRAAEFLSGELSESEFLSSAAKYLGSGYKEVSPGRFLSADRSRQVRFGRHEVRGNPLHGHFESLEDGRVTENARVIIRPDQR